jgi:hypothetical protein
MKILKISMASLFILSLYACSTVTIKSDFDPEYDFSKFKTYRWATDDEWNPNDELSKYPLVKKRAMAAIDKALAAKGFTRVEGKDAADVVMVIHAASKERMQVHNTGGGYYHGWYDPWWGPYGGTTTVSYYEEATLVVDMVSWKTKELAWRGMATGTVKQNQNAAEQQQRLDDIAMQIFANYPPK